MTRYLVSVVLWGAVLTLWPHAGTFAQAPPLHYDGKLLLDACAGDLRNAQGRADVMQAGCAGYVMGFVDALTAVAPGTTCFPPHTTTRTITEQLVAWLRAHEDAWSKEWREVLPAMLRDVYPCKTTPAK